MFASLEEQMKHDDSLATSPRQRMTKWAVISFVAVAVFGALYYAIRPLLKVNSPNNSLRGRPFREALSFLRSWDYTPTS